MEKQMWHIHTMEYYSAIKRNETGSFVETMVQSDIKSERKKKHMCWTVVQSEVSQKDKNILYINTRIWNLEKWYR